MEYSRNALRERNRSRNYVKNGIHVMALRGYRQGVHYIQSTNMTYIHFHSSL